MTSVLVIDDCPDARMAMCRLLTSFGYEVRESVDGKQGLQSYLSAPADIILLDIFMPVMDWKRLTDCYGTTRRQR